MDEISDHFVFRMGKLHLVFTTLKILGKFIDGIGLDQSFQEAGIYGETTMGQIKEGKHLYRALEAHFILYLSIYRKYIAKLTEFHPIIEKDVREHFCKLSTLLENDSEKNNEDILQKHKEMIGVLVSLNFHADQKIFDDNLKN